VSQHTLILASFFGIEYLIAYAIIAAISIGAGLALRRRSSQSSMDVQSEQPSNQTARGGFIPVVMGRRRVASCFLYIGDRETKEEIIGYTSGGKGGGGGSVAIKQTVFLERGWIGLCCQRAFAVRGIYKDGRLLANSQFTKINVASGSRIDFEKDGSALIFWGEDHPEFTHPITQIDDESMMLLQTITGVASKWHGVAFMIWDKLRLGQVARWGNMEYDIESAPPIELDGYTSTSIVGIESDRGWNPALCILLLLIQESPNGCGIAPCRIVYDTFNELGDLLNTEGISANILIQDGQTAENVIAGILEDIGAMLYEIDGRIAIKAIRKVADPLPINDSQMLPPYEEIDRFHRITQTDQVVFTYPNVNRDFAPDIVNIEDDGSSEGATRRRQRRVALTIATSEGVAWKIANRRIQENFAPLAKYAIKFIRDFKNLTPGDVVRHPVLGDLRLIETTYDATSPITNCLFVQDTYGQAVNYTDPDDGGPTPIGTLPLADHLFSMFEYPRTLLQKHGYAQTVPAFVPLRVRKRNSVIQASIYRGLDPTELSVLTTTPRRQFGGFLYEDMRFGPADTRCLFSVFINNNYSGEPGFSNLDKALHIMDLISNTPTTTQNDWVGGGIVVVIGPPGSEEVCFAKSIDIHTLQIFTGVIAAGVNNPVLPVIFRVSGLIRARHQTVARAHPKNTRIFVFSTHPINVSQQPPILQGDYQQGQNLIHRSQPFNYYGQTVPLLNCPTSTLTVDNKWGRAIPIVYINYGEKVPAPVYRVGMTEWYRPNFGPLTLFHTYAMKVVGGAPKVAAAIAIDMPYPSNTYSKGAGATAYANGSSGHAAPETRLWKTVDRFVLEVWFRPFDPTKQAVDTTGKRIDPVLIRQQTVVDPQHPTDANLCHARYYGTVTIDYSAFMHEQDRAKVRDLINGSSPTPADQWQVKRTQIADDGDNSFSEETNPVIGDVGVFSNDLGAPTVPIFYIRICQYRVLDNEAEEQLTVRYYYSYASGIRHEFRAPRYDELDAEGDSTWHNADYDTSGFDGGSY